MNKESIQVSIRQFLAARYDCPPVGNKLKQVKQVIEDAKQVLDERKNGKAGDSGVGEPAAPGG